ncbi:MAG: hypothetical protein ACE5IK_14790 [Acidobacteriota bacterium]
MGEHDAGYIDAYYGPDAWRSEVQADVPSLSTIRRQADELIGALEELDVTSTEEMTRLRRRFLIKQLSALSAYTGILIGDHPLTFDEESRLLYDAVAPHHDEDHFREILQRLEKLVPGRGPLAQRYERFRRGFVIPPDKLDDVFQAGIAEARRRTRQHIALPAGENFRVEYVTDKPWSGYNWYQGHGQSLIQINTDLPIFIDRAIDLACHEGYPGHHVYNALLEQHMVKERGWAEFSVYPLYSPQSLIAEGSANYGIAVAFPASDRVAFERDVLFPIAGLVPSRAEIYDRIMELVGELNYAGNEAARRYLDGAIDATAAASWLERFALMPPERARQRIKFIEKYRSYVINYNLGKDLVRRYIEMKGGSEDRPGRRWQEFEQLLSSPRVPSGLR